MDPQPLESLSQSAPPPVTPPPPLIKPMPSQSNHMIWKVLVGILLFIIVGLGVLLVYLLQKNSELATNLQPQTTTSMSADSVVKDETDGWKTYVGADYSFKYPPDVLLDGNDESISISKTGTKKLNGSDSTEELGIVFGNLRKIEGESLEIFVKNIAKSFAEQCCEIVEQPHLITINKLDGYTFVSAEGNGVNRSIYFLTPDKKSYIEITDSSSDADPTNKIYGKIANQILSTFAFVDTTKNSTIVIPTQKPVVDASPLSNTLYSATYKGSEVVFITSKLMNSYYDNGTQKVNQDRGYVLYLDNKQSETVSYKELITPKRLVVIDTPGDVSSVNSFNDLVLNSDKSKLYVLLDKKPAGNEYPDIRQELFQIDLKLVSKKLVWSHIIGDDLYPLKGSAHLRMVESDKYAVMSLVGCYACDGVAPHGSMVVNVETGKETYLGEVGEFTFNLAEKIITYKKLVEMKEDCVDGQGCENGKMKVYKPAGNVLSSKLP